MKGQFLSCLGEPIYINPASVEASIQAASTHAFVTQTVYGFLDFTTTIGNTVMVFSPQSAAPEVQKASEVTENAVIDTKPTTAATTTPPLTIKPSKTQSKSENKASADIHTVSASSDAPLVIASKVEIKYEPASRINVKSEAVSVVKSNTNVESKFEVVAVPARKVPEKNIITKVEVISETSKLETPPVISSRVEVYEGSASSVATPPPILSSVVDIQTAEEAIVIGNNIAEPEYDFLSRQPSEVVEETYKVINLKPSSKFHLKPRPSIELKNKQAAATRSDPLHPTGLVTKLGGTIVKDGVTTVHETKVIGTYIAGKYAQVLQSTSHIQQNSPKAKIKPSSTLRILKTAAPTQGKGNKYHQLEPTPASSISVETALPIEHIKTTRKSNAGGNSLKRLKQRTRDQDLQVESETTPSPAKKNGSKPRTTQPPRSTTKQHTTSQRPQKRNKKNGGKTARLATISVHSEPPPTTTPASQASRKFQPRKNKQKVNAAPSDFNSAPSRRGYKPRGAQLQPSSIEPTSSGSSVYKFKLNRTPGRWQYKTSAKPKVTIRKQNDDEVTNTTSSYGEVSNINEVTPISRSDDEGLIGSESIASIVDDESSTENKLDNAYPLETLKVEISTPPNFKDTYYEIATVKSPYTFQIGSVKNTRYVTVTSTIQKTIEGSTVDNAIVPTNTEPLTENILATANNYDKDNNFLDSSVATLPPLYMAAEMETPPLETLTETFSTSQKMLKTHILPAVRGGNITSSYTLVQTYLVTRFVTATKTLPPMEAYHFVPSKTLNEFNSYLDEAGSELNLELAFGDENDNEADSQPRRAFLADLDLASIGSDFDLSDVDKSSLSAHSHLRSKKAHGPTTPKTLANDPLSIPGLSSEQIQQLALLRLLNPGSGQAQVITTSKPVLKIETIYESHVVPILNGHNTILTTITKPLGTVTKTDYEFGTSTIAAALPALPNLPIPPINGLFPQQQPQFAVTTSSVLQTTVVTETSSKILKLTFGAKTAYTTILSTTLVPTVLTTYMTGSVPVQPTAAFPGYFPAPYPAFPYLG
ncbi:hypothetical protein FQA39_LY11858 [Lamprigera yunnana]|nr:hypothetical protein FQA39_LY11858 [Lamprigera yunnana]